MNETLHHPKVSVRISLGTRVFVAGEDVYGKMEVKCNSSETTLGMRTIGIALTGVERS